MVTPGRYPTDPRDLIARSALLRCRDDRYHHRLESIASTTLTTAVAPPVRIFIDTSYLFINKLIGWWSSWGTTRT